MRFFFILLTGLVLLSACGSKGPVRPFEEHSPKAVNSARLMQRGENFQLQWKMPKHNLDGSQLEDLEYIQVERLFSTEEEFCSECTTPWPVIARIHPQRPAPARQIKDFFLLSDRGAGSGQTARYRLRARNQEGTLGDPLLLKQVYQQAQPAPQGLQALAHDRSIDLAWQAASPTADAGFVGYLIYRRRADQPFSALATNIKPLQKNKFSDYGLDNGQTYYYRVRSLFEVNGVKLESMPGDEISVTPAAG